LSSRIKEVEVVEINIEDIGGGKPVVFIHGWPVNLNMFEYQFTELPKHEYRCINIDLRDFSDKPWDDYNYDTMADDIKAVLDNLDLHDATSVKFSMGSSISIRYMSRHQGAHIKKLALLGALNFTNC
jgi:non-heme chloroperoxidase